jgi:predicted metal-binding membrane protein
MTVAAGGLSRRRLATPETALLTALAAAAWVATFALSRGMSSMTGTMGMGTLEFVPAWTLMMAAMMLPAVGVTGSIYARTIVTYRVARLGGFLSGYLVVWALSGLPALALARLAGELTTSRPAVSHALAVGLFALCGIYQLTPLKDRCLAHCRSPLGLVMRYGSYRGRSRDLRAGLHHGAYCLACCWALMALLIAVGVMNLLAMVGLTVLVVTEKLWARGPWAGRLAGVVTLGLAVALIWVPSLAPGLDPSPMAHMMGS